MIRASVYGRLGADPTQRTTKTGKVMVTILDPRKFWHALRNDLRAGPEACAGRRETIGRTLKRLYELFYTPAGSAEVTK